MAGFKEYDRYDAMGLAECVRRGDVTAVDLCEEAIQRIERINPQLNAVITPMFEMARETGRQPLAEGPFAGVPFLLKDLLLAYRGVPMASGCKVYRDFRPDYDSTMVVRYKRAGLNILGKTNTPEFGAGSQTYNKVFGETLNPYDTTRTCGGSSGGAAVALACGMMPIADGSDMGGSLRNPASFCNVVGLRPSPGRVPSWPGYAGWFPYPVEGPMARTVEDAALMLSTIAGPDPRSPIAITQPGNLFSQSLKRNFKEIRIAWSHDLGMLPVDPQVTIVIEGQRQVFEDLGCLIDDCEPDFSNADEIFKVWRAWYFELVLSEVLETQRNKLKDSVIWNIEEGRKLSGPELGAIERKRTELYHRVRRFMKTYEFLILPVSQVPPFDVRQRYVKEINGEKMGTYIDWMKSCYYITTIGYPAISVPCGFTADGLPVGVQIVGRHQDDLGVLQLAYAFEQATGFWKRKPPVVLQ